MIPVYSSLLPEFTLGLAMDEVTPAVQAAVVKDVLALLGEYDGTWSFQLLLPGKHEAALRGFLEQLDGIRDGKMVISIYQNVIPKVDVWCRYVVEESVPLSGTVIYDRIVKQELKELEINNQESYPAEPANITERPAPAHTDLLSLPMPNPYQRSWEQFANTSRPLKKLR
jgi:hypothetical protein